MATKKEIIGSEVRVAESSNIHNIGMEGVVINETKNMLIIKTKHGEKKMIKRQNKFELRKEGKVFLINGRLIEKRPEERIR